MKFTDIKDIIWSSEDRTVFTCSIAFEEITFEDYTRIAININDKTDYVQEIWNEVISGKWGLIADFVPPVVAPQRTTPYILSDYPFSDFLIKLTREERIRLITLTQNNIDAKIWYDDRYLSNKIVTNEITANNDIEILVNTGVLTLERFTKIYLDNEMPIATLDNLDNLI